MSRTRRFHAYNQSINSELPYLISIITSHLRMQRIFNDPKKYVTTAFRGNKIFLKKTELIFEYIV